MSAFDEIEVPPKTEGDPAAATVEPPAVEQPVAPEPEPVPVEQEPPAEPSGVTALEGTTQEGTAPPEDEDLTRDIETRKATHGENWAIKAYRDLYKEKRKAQPVLELAQKHGVRAVQVGTELAAAYLDLEGPVESIPELMKQASPSRFNSFRNHLFWQTAEAYPDVALRGLLGEGFENVTVEQAKQMLTRQQSTPAEPEKTSDWWEDPDAEDPNDLSKLPTALRKEIEESRAMRAKFPELEREVAGFRTQREQAQVETREQEVKKLGDDLYSKVWSVVEGRVNTLGLETKPTDTPRVRGIKHALRNQLSRESIEEAFDASDENKQLVTKTLGFVKALERENAEGYVEPLTVAAELALQGKLESPEVKELLTALKSEMQAQSTPKNPTAREELVAGAPAGFTPPDPFEEGRKEGKNPFDVSVELAGRQQRPVAPGL